MKKFKKIGLVIGVIGILCAATIGKKMLQKQDKFLVPQYLVSDATNVAHFFPKTVNEIDQLAKTIMAETKAIIDQIIEIPTKERTFKNTIIAFDRADSQLSIVYSILSTLFYLSPKEQIRNAAHNQMLALSQFSIDTITYNVKLYQAFKAYIDGNAHKEQLDSKQQYYLDELVKSYKRTGIDLPEEQRAIVQKLKKELSELTMIFDQNINSDHQKLMVNRDELEGLDDDFIAGLEKTADGKFILGTDYPTYFAVMEHGANSNTRKQLYYLFTNRAYPKNLDVLQEIIAKRDQLASILNYKSYAHLNLDDEMIKNPEQAYKFLYDLLAKTSPKETIEFKKLIEDLPAGVILSADGKLNPWDKTYVNSQYKKKHYQLDDREVAEYFPMEQTVKGLMNIYEQFFNLKMTELPVSDLWDPSVTLMQIKRADNDALLGLLLLDLYPRENKYSHACQISLIQSTYNQEGAIVPALAVVIANFPKSTPDKPSLLKLHDVRTFFHEFGHAIHTILGTTALAATSGTRVKTDFVEMPSQMLEEWLWDFAILKMLSHHYKTGQPIPDSLINTIIELKNFDSGAWVDRQILYSLLSLELFGPGKDKNIQQIQEKIFKLTRAHDVYDPKNHDFASFGHLTGYGARYYSYLWSKVFAIDLFYYIKQFGLLNSEIGRKYANIILGNGGSVDPNDLLFQFLGREPTIDAFITDLGLSAR